MEFSLENSKLHANFSPYESKLFDRLKAEYIALLDGKTYEYYQAKKDLRRQGELNKKLAQIEDFYSNPEKRKEMIPVEVYVEGLEGVFGKGNLDLMPLPDPEDLNDAYFEDKFPRTQRSQDSKRNLKCFVPRWWDKLINLNNSDELVTFGQYYIRSMKADILKLREEGWTGIVTETTCQYSQHDVKFTGEPWIKDKLLHTIAEVIPKKEQFGRCGLTWLEITNKLIPKVTDKIIAKWQAQDLPIPSFKVTITPSLVTRELMEKHPELSRNFITEWTSTAVQLRDSDMFVSNLAIGGSEGGAGYVKRLHPDVSDSEIGFRLSILFKGKLEE